MSHRMEMGKPRSCRRVIGGHRLREQRDAGPRGLDHHLQFVSVTLRIDAEPVDGLERITSVAALRVGQLHAGFNFKPKRGKGVGEAAANRRIFFRQVARADHERLRPLPAGRREERQLPRCMLAVRVHRNGVGEAAFFRPGKPGAERGPLALVARQGNNGDAAFPRENLPGVIRGTVVDDDHGKILLRFTHDAANRQAVVENRNDNADGRFAGHINRACPQSNGACARRQAIAAFRFQPPMRP
jgi:hypothetical protein